jgi:hypothetical protein
LELSQHVLRIIELAGSVLQLLGRKVFDRCLNSLAMPANQLKPVGSRHFGEREPRDACGELPSLRPKMIELNETVISGPLAVALFQAHHPDDDHQASYHH